jgi:hypothetical protein
MNKGNVIVFWLWCCLLGLEFRRFRVFKIDGLATDPAPGALRVWKVGALVCVEDGKHETPHHRLWPRRYGLSHL